MTDPDTTPAPADPPVPAETPEERTGTTADIQSDAPASEDDAAHDDTPRDFTEEGEHEPAAGEYIGKVAGPDIDKSYPTYDFYDPKTGERLDTVQTVHEVPVGTNADGSPIMAKMTDDFVKESSDS